MRIKFSTCVNFAEFKTDNEISKKYIFVAKMLKFFSINCLQFEYFDSGCSKIALNLTQNRVCLICIANKFLPLQQTILVHIFQYISKSRQSLGFPRNKYDLQFKSIKPIFLHEYYLLQIKAKMRLVQQGNYFIEMSLAMKIFYKA